MKKTTTHLKNDTRQAADTKILNALYVHIPFCRIRCSYCAFNTFTDRQHLIADYTAAVIRELQMLTRPELAVHTIYFGGGTPSLLSPSQIGGIIEAVDQNFNLASDAEISMEANPGTVDLDYFQGIYAAGVRRLSLGMQSASQDELFLFGRLHTHSDVIRAVENARKAGFENISLDLIYGVPNQTRQVWQASLEAVLALNPDHVSLYALGIESGTEMKRRVTAGDLPLPDPDLAADMYDDATAWLGDTGFIQYEISNWGKPGRFCQHNLQYWRNLPYPGVGAGAHGYIAGYRTVNAMKPEVYINCLRAQQKPLEFPRTRATIKAELIDRETDMFETIFMGLRLLEEGFSLQKFAARYGERFEVRFAPQLQRLIAEGLIWRDGDLLKLTSRARLLSNRVFEEFIDDA